jgi:hypothetical protein
MKKESLIICIVLLITFNQKGNSQINKTPSERDYTKVEEGNYYVVDKVKGFIKADTDNSDTTGGNKTVFVAREVDKNRNASKLFVISPVENVIAQQIRLFPNPATDKVTIKSLTPDINQTYTIKVFDNLGQEVLNTPFQKGLETKMNVAGLAPGIYSVVITNGKQNYVQKLIVQAK